jgi:hypothetical protein
MQALALEKLGTDFFDNAAHFQSAESTFCYDVPQEDVVVDGNVIFTNGAFSRILFYVQPS